MKHLSIPASIAALAISALPIYAQSYPGYGYGLGTTASPAYNAGMNNTFMTLLNAATPGSITTVPGSFPTMGSFANMPSYAWGTNRFIGFGAYGGNGWGSYPTYSPTGGIANVTAVPTGNGFVTGTLNGWSYYRPTLLSQGSFAATPYYTNPAALGMNGIYSTSYGTFGLANGMYYGATSTPGLYSGFARPVERRAVRRPCGGCRGQGERRML